MGLKKLTHCGTQLQSADESCAKRLCCTTHSWLAFGNEWAQSHALCIVQHQTLAALEFHQIHLVSLFRLPWHKVSVNNAAEINTPLYGKVQSEKTTINIDLI